MLIVPRGIPASGKSTWCKEFVSDTTSSFSRARLSRDDLRQMMYGVDFGPPVDENMITTVFDTAAFKLLNEVDCLILDNTNINLRYIRKILMRAQSLGKIIQFKYFDIDLETAIARNAARERQVPEDVIRIMYDNYTKIDRAGDKATYE